MQRFVIRFVAEESTAATAIEYDLIAAGIAHHWYPFRYGHRGGVPMFGP